MNFLSIVEPISPQLEFLEHGSFGKEAAALERRFPFAKGLVAFKLLCQKHFHLTDPIPIIAPGKIHRVGQLAAGELWKVELAIKGIKSNQSPRVWFAKDGGRIVLLCARSHIDNYDNNTVDREAADRATEFF